MKVDIRVAELLGRELHGMFMGRQEVTTREHHSVPRRSLVNALTACCELFKAAIYLRPEAVVLADKSISFLVLQRVLQQALKTLKLNAATGDFSVINYENPSSSSP